MRPTLNVVSRATVLLIWYAQFVRVTLVPKYKKTVLASKHFKHPSVFFLDIGERNLLTPPGKILVMFDLLLGSMPCRDTQDLEDKLLCYSRLYIYRTE